MTPRSPWPALWAIVIGFFMILVDTTIVSVANPAIKAALDPDSSNLDNVVWVTSAYLLAYAAPLLVTGRLGDRFGPKRIYLLGLVIFTLGSLGSGLSGSLDLLIITRAVQGLGAALMTPQTMAVITRTFPPAIRGAAMGLWGSTAGVAMLVGPLLGGVLVDALGWQWVFFINLPVGVVAFVLAAILVPRLETHPHRFDLGGVALSALGIFLLAFGLQQAAHYDWGVIWGPISVWSLIGAGIVLMIVFVWWQSRTRREALVPLELFRDRNFSLSNIGIFAGGFAITALMLPFMFFLQLARGLTPTQSALIMVPLAVVSAVFSPVVGRLLDRVDPRWIIVPATLTIGAGLIFYILLMTPDSNVLWYLVPSVMMGFGNAGMWGPLAATATRNLAPRMAGAGSGVYNTTRTIGSVLGSAGIAALMQSRIDANLPLTPDGATPNIGGGPLPEALVAPFSAAMAESLLLPMVVIVLGGLSLLFLQRPPRPGEAGDDGSPQWVASKLAGTGTGTGAGAGVAPAAGAGAGAGADAGAGAEKEPAAEAS